MNNREHIESSSPDPDQRHSVAEPESEAWGASDHFLRLMFFMPSHGAGVTHPAQRPERPPGEYAPLVQSRAMTGAEYYLPHPSTAMRVSLESPAVTVMTDLRRVEAVTIGRSATIQEANRTMITSGVRALFVIDDNRHLSGIITSSDILGEKPIQLTQQRGLRHDEISVRDIMTPAERLEVMDLSEVIDARVGDIVATLRQSGRQHALVVDRSGSSGQHNVCGIFSLTQIGRQLGVPPQPLHDIGRTFAEIEAAIAP